MWNNTHGVFIYLFLAMRDITESFKLDPYGMWDELKHWLRSKSAQSVERHDHKVLSELLGPFDQAKYLRSRGPGYSVRVTPIPAGTWRLNPKHDLPPPSLLYWATFAVEGRNWVLWFWFYEPPMEHLDRSHHDGIVVFFAKDSAPHHLMIPGFTFDLFVGFGETIAKGEILKVPVDAFLDELYLRKRGEGSSS